MKRSRSHVANEVCWDCTSLAMHVFLVRSFCQILGTQISSSVERYTINGYEQSNALPVGMTTTAPHKPRAPNTGGIG